jgi:hypothetical protein
MSTVGSYRVVVGTSVRVSVNIAQEVTVLVTVVVVVSLDVDLGTGGGKMYETLTHPDVVVEVVVKGYTASVPTVCQTVGSEGFTVTVLLTQDVTVAAVVTARRPTSTPGAAFSAANATPANQGKSEKKGMNSMSSMEPAESLVEDRCTLRSPSRSVCSKPKPV